VFASLGYGGGAPVGIVAGDAILIRYLVQRSKTFVLEPATLPVVARGVIAALDCIEESERARARVQGFAQRIRSNLGTLGYFPVVMDANAQTHIVSIPFTNRSEAESFAEALFKKSILVEVVWAGKALSELCYIRIIPTDLHTDEQIDMLLQSCADLTLRNNH
jgi:8-amino-7-oxononanoate synthase